MKKWIWMGMCVVIICVYCAPAHIVNEQSVLTQDSIALSKEIDSLHMGYEHGYNNGMDLGRHEYNPLQGYFITNCILGTVGAAGCAGCFGIIGLLGGDGNSAADIVILDIAGCTIASSPLVILASENRKPKHVAKGDSLYVEGFIDGYSKGKNKSWTVFAAVMGGICGALMPVLIGLISLP